MAQVSEGTRTARRGGLVAKMSTSVQKQQRNGAACGGATEDQREAAQRFSLCGAVTERGREAGGRDGGRGRVRKTSAP